MQASIQGDLVRVSGRDRDTLQDVIALLRGQDFGIDMQFTNYRHATECRAGSNRLFIDGPAGKTGSAARRARRSGATPGRAGLPSASAARRHHAQQSGVPDRARNAPRRSGGAAIQLSRRQHERRRVRQRRWARPKMPAPRWSFSAFAAIRELAVFARRFFLRFAHHSEDWAAKLRASSRLIAVGFPSQLSGQSAVRPVRRSPRFHPEHARPILPGPRRWSRTSPALARAQSN